MTPPVPLPMATELLSAGATITVKATLILLMALALARHLGSARVRHALWSSALVAVLLLPVFTSIPGSGWLPGWELAILPAADPVAPMPPRAAPAMGDAHPGPTGATAGVPGSPGEPPAIATGGARPAPSPEPTTRPEPASRASTTPHTPWAAMVVALWFSGVAVVTARLIRGVLAATRIPLRRRSSDRGPAEHLERILDVERRRLGIRRRVRLVTHAGPIPMTWGDVRPVIALPSDADSWTEDRLRVVLRHELAHVRRHDWLVHVVARLACAAYWFNPLVWTARRRLEAERELACDEDVVRAGTRPSEYAHHLLEMARSLRLDASSGLEVLAMSRTGNLEARIMSILKKDVKRNRGVAVTVSLLTLVLGAVLGIASPQARDVNRPDGAGVAAAGLLAAGIEAEPEAVADGRAAAGATRTVEARREHEAQEALEAARALEAAEARAGTGGSFSGELIRDGDHVVYQHGLRDGEFVFQMTDHEAGLRMLVEGDVDVANGEITRMDGNAIVVLSAFDDGTRIRAEILPDEHGRPTYRWRVGHEDRPVDEAAQGWIRAAVAILADNLEKSEILGERSHLRAEGNAIRSERNALRAEINGVRAARNGLTAEISGIAAHGDGLRAEIDAMRAERNRIQVEIDAAEIERRGLEERLQRLDARDADEQESVRVGQDLEKVELYIRKLQQELDIHDVDRRTEEIERKLQQLAIEEQEATLRDQIDDLDVDGRVRELEQRIIELDVDGRLKQIQQRIEALKADERVEVIEERLDERYGELEGATRLVVKPR